MNVFVDKNKIDLLANAISAKSGESLTLTLDEMVEAVDGIEQGGGGITPTGNIDITQAGVTDVTNYATATVPQGEMYADYTTGYKTVSGVRRWYLKPAAKIESGDGYGTEGYIADHTVEYGNEQTYNAVASGTTVTPTTSAQTIGGANYMMEGAVTVSAMPSGTAGTPTATKGAVSNHSVSVTPSVTNTTGYITGSTKTGTAVTVSASELVSGDKSITANGNNIDVANYSTVSVNVSGGSGMTVATATATPSTASASIQFTGLQGEPTSFAVTSIASLATGASPYKTATVVFDGTDLHGQIVTNTSNANASYSTSFTKSYSNGTLTITGSGTNFQANQYKLVYTYGGNSSNTGTAETQVGSGATSVTFTGLTDEPDYFSVIFKSDFGTSSGYQRVMSITYDGTDVYGMAMDSVANQAFSDSWSYSYSNGSLTITSASANHGGYFHQPGYYQLTYGVGGTVAPVQIDVESITFTENGTYTAPSGTAYSPVTVAVSGGGGSSKNAQSVQGTTRTTSATLTAIGAEMTVSKTGTYDVYWSAFRSNTSSQYTFATKLYINGTGYGSEQTTWSNHQQNVHLSNVSLSANDKIRVYGRESRGSSYYMYAGTLTIIEA